MSNKPSATDNHVWIIRDEVKKEIGGLILPSSGKIKPHTGQIFSAGDLVEDKKIKSGKKAIFHPGVGQPIEYENVDYLILKGHEIIGVV